MVKRLIFKQNFVFRSFFYDVHFVSLFDFETFSFRAHVTRYSSISIHFLFGLYVGVKKKRTEKEMRSLSISFINFLFTSILSIKNMRAFIKIVLLVSLFSLVSCRSVPYFSNDAEVADFQQDSDDQNPQDPLLYLRLNSELDQDSDDSNNSDDETDAKSRFVFDSDDTDDDTELLDDNHDDDDEQLQIQNNLLQNQDESLRQLQDEVDRAEISKNSDRFQQTEQEESEIE